MAGGEDKAGFEERMKALEGVVERLERGELTLDDSMRLFEEGVRLSESCKQELASAEGRIQVLVERQAGGMDVAELEVEEETDAEEDDLEG